MMDDLDAILTRLAGMPVPAALHGIDQSVFDGVAMRVAQRQLRKVGVVSISGALLVGIVLRCPRAKRQLHHRWLLYRSSPRFRLPRYLGI